MKAVAFLSILFLVGCKSDSKQDESLVSEEAIAYTITADDVEALEYDDYVLSPKSKSATADWNKFKELQENIEFLKKGNLSFFQVEKQIMQEFIVELKREQPETVTTPAIRARVTVLETNLLRLQNLANLDNIKKKDLLSAIKELLIANVNLKLQINKKFERESQRIELPSI